MTVCVAGIAARSRAIVTVSDKAITYGTEYHIQADAKIKKVLPIGGTGWHAMIGGDPSFSIEIIQVCVDRINNPVSPETAVGNAAKAGTMTGMMALMKESYQLVRKRAVSDRLLSPALLDENTIFRRSAELLPLPDEYIDRIIVAASDYNAKCSLLVCGFDSLGAPHIFSVVNPGIAINHDIPGFHAIGIGKDIAIARLYAYEVSTDWNLDSMMYVLFDAKAEAELIESVGYEYDLNIILGKDSKPTEVRNGDVRRSIENLYSESNRSPLRKNFGRHLRKYPRWRRIIKEYAESLFKQHSDHLKSESQKLKSKR